MTLKSAGTISENGDDLFLFERLQKFYLILLDELGSFSGNVTAEEQLIEQYYKKLFHEPKLCQFYQYNWRRRVQPMAQLLLELPRREMPWRILDAGCGVGTEAMLWASLRNDVEVTGVDISAERLQAASSRSTYYEHKIGHSLRIEFCDQSVFSILKEKSFDFIWSMEALSHIDPAEEFLASAFANLPAGGKLVISDSHLLNPAMLWRIFKLRRQGIRQTYKSTTAGEIISYAEERLFSVPGLVRMLRRVGFNTVSTQLSIFLPPVMAQFRFFPTLDNLLNSVPIIRYSGGIYTIVAVKS